MTDRTYVAVCAGGGIGCYGFQLAGWKLVAAVEKEAWLRDHLAERFHGVQLHGDLTTLRGRELPRASAWFVSLPCQAASDANTRSDKPKGFDDPRGALFRDFARVLRECRGVGNAPRAILFENVPSYLGTNNGRDAREVGETLGEAGYTLVDSVLADAREHGLGQRRVRLFACWVQADAGGRSPVPG